MPTRGSLAQESKTPWKESEQTGALLAMLKLAAVLNPQSDRLPAVIIDVVVEVERRYAHANATAALTQSSTSRSVSSPYRPLLIEYLDHVPKEAADYFFDRLSQPVFFALFLHVIDGSHAIRADIMERKGPSEGAHLIVEMVGRSSDHRAILMSGTGAAARTRCAECRQC